MNAGKRALLAVPGCLRIACAAGLAAGLVGMTGLTGCAPLPLNAPTQHEHCQPSFPDEDGWFGGDAAFSVSLDSHSSLWFFGDSFVARPTDSEVAPQRIYPFIHNAIGRSTCGPKGEWRIGYDWAKTQPPHAFFQPDPEAAWVKRAAAESAESPYYWPLAPFLLDDVLYIGLLRVQASEASGPFNLPFRLVGADLARVQNPAAPSEEWKIEITSLSDQTSAIPGSAWVVQGDYLYAFAYQNGANGRTPQFLARLPLAALSRWPADLSRHLETLGPSGEWVDGLTPNRARILMDDDATEMSVHYSKAEKAWLAVYSDPTPAFEGAQEGVLWLRRAKTIEGPWSAPQALAVVPERSPGNALAEDPNIFCYAGKAHPQFGGAGELVVTYVCNLYARAEKEIPGTLERLRESPGIYRPRAMRIKIPPPGDR